MVIKMTDVKSAVVRASNKSRREGEWANKNEISDNIIGRHPSNLDGELLKLVKGGSIEKKSSARLWRPIHGAGGAGSPSAKRGRVSGYDDRETGDRDKGDDRRTSDNKKPDNRLTEDTARVATGGALAAGTSTGAVSSSITRMLL
jgi:hypothetical protein